MNRHCFISELINKYNMCLCLSEVDIMSTVTCFNQIHYVIERSFLLV